LGCAHARTARFNIISFDSAARFPVGPVSFEPRFRFARRTDRFGPGHQKAYRPSLRFTYAASTKVALDAEIGFTFLDQRWSDAAFVGKSEERATILNLGYRFFVLAATNNGERWQANIAWPASAFHDLHP
jgi:hypothetical protein